VIMQDLRSTTLDDSSVVHQSSAVAVWVQPPARLVEYEIGRANIQGICFNDNVMWVYTVV
jgi:hypothetical protein